ncbi:HTH-type transcriptional repressor RspR [bioreactor metagenome]|uniref:HTH-type transcriptional repressor RspR n=1 Tax=bioreactor metagenome TaxID=1076179 RepID=A0A645AGJ3_9ZZZZ
MALQKISLVEQARTELLRRIVTGLLPAGTRLTEESLCAEFAISRTPVRDALSRLETDGLIERLPTRGYQVCLLDLAAIDELLVCRMKIELMILRENYAGLAIAGLRELRAELAAADPDAADALETARTVDDRLHRLVGDAADNRFLREFHARLLCRRLPYRDFRNSPGALSPAELRRERLALLDALLSGDSERACRALAEHLEAGRRDVLAAMRQIPQ